MGAGVRRGSNYCSASISVSDTFARSLVSVLSVLLPPLSVTTVEAGRVSRLADCDAFPANSGTGSNILVAFKFD